MADKKKNIYEIITERFLAQLDEGIVPWKKPWISINGDRVGGYSHTTGKPYSLINQMMLPSEGEYITYKQIQEEGGKLKKGSKGFPICFWKSFETTKRNIETNQDEKITIPCLRYYTVFRLEDCEGIEPKYAPDLSELDGLKEPAKIKVAEKTIKSYVKSSGVKFKNKESNSAYYSPIEDEVVVPLKKQFESSGEYYSTVFHELVHSTGHVSRLNRVGNTKAGRTKNYSLEELVAEIGSEAIMYKLRIENEDTVSNSNAYLKSWYKALSNDVRMIVSAASRAEKAVKYMFGEEVHPNHDYKPKDYSEPKPTEADKALYPEGCPF